MSDARTVKPGHAVVYHNEPRRPTAPITLAPGAITVTLDRADAVGLGFTLVALANAGKPNPETAALFARVGQQLVAAATAQDKP